MTDAKVIQEQVPANTSKEPLSFVRRWWRGRSLIERYSRIALAAWLWGYVFLQLFVFDLDGWLISELPEPLSLLVRFKFLVLLLAAASINFVPRKQFWAWVIYIAIAPFVLCAWCFWFVTKRVAIGLLKLKSWSLFFAVVNQFIEFVSGLKVTAFLAVVSLISIVIIALSRSPDTLISASISLALVVITLVARRLVAIFRPTPIFNLYVRTVAAIMQYSRAKLVKPATPLTGSVLEMTPEEFKVQCANLSTAVALIETCEFLKVRFGEYRSSKTAIATYILALVGLALASVLLIATANYGLYLANTHSFSISGGHSWFDFLYYTFGAVTTQRIPEIQPASLGAKLLSVLETVLGWVFFAGTILSLYFSIKRSNEDQEIADALVKLEEEKNRMRDFVRVEYSVTLDEAIAALERVQDNIVTFVNLLKKGRGLA